MPLEHEHDAQRRENLAFLESIASISNANNWQVIVVFYAALHSLERFLARMEAHPPDHARRKLALVRHTRALTRPIIHDYRTLYTWSIRYRYMCQSASSEIVEAAKQKLTRIDAKVKSLLDSGGHIGT